MKHLSEYITESTKRFKTIEDVEKFLEQFPNDAKSWRQATEEVRDIARTAREYLEEYDEIAVEAVNFRAIKTPAEWNTKGKQFAIDTIKKMRDNTRERFLASLNDMFA